MEGTVGGAEPFSEENLGFRRGWYLQGEPDRTWDGIHDVVMGLTSEIPLRSLRIHTFDPRLAGRMSVFAPLRQHHAPAFPSAISGASEFCRVMEKITDTGRDAGADGRWAAEDDASDEDGHGDTFHVVVVLNYPEAVDACVQRELLRLTAEDAPAGVLVLVQADESATPASKRVEPDELAANLERVHTPHG